MIELCNILDCELLKFALTGSVIIVGMLFIILCFAFIASKIFKDE